MKIKGHELREGARNGGKLGERGFSYPLDEFDEGGGFCLLELRSFEPPFLLCFIHFLLVPLQFRLCQMLERGLSIEKCSTSCYQLSISKLQISLLK